jgi:hypothetical protein
MLPPDKLDWVEDRFLREHPVLARAIAELTDATGCTRKPGQDPEWDPRVRQFGQLLVRGACLAELFRREAGHPLRQLDEAEINSILRADMQQADALSKSSVPGGPDIFTTSSQPDLLRGVVIGHLSVEGVSEQEAKALMIYRFLVQALHRAAGDEPPVPSGDWDHERILIAFSAQGDPLRHAALQVAESFRAQLTPQLVDSLDRWAAEPEAALEEDGCLEIHALFLLAKWREDSAWPAYRKLFSLSGHIAHNLLGDLITEHGPVLLAMIGRRQHDELQAMIEDEKLDEHSRVTCLDALTCLVAWDEMPRQEYVSYLRELLTIKLRNVPENSYVFGGAVSAACDLEAWELRPEVEAAYHRGAVDEGFIDLEFFLNAAIGKRRGQWREFCERHHPLADVAAATLWLDEPPPPSFPEEPLPEHPEIIADSTEPYVAPPKIGRNEPCPCDSGKKYKKCCGSGG